MVVSRGWAWLLASALVAPAVANAQVTLTFWDNQQTESGLSQYQQAAVERFEAANPDIKIEVVTVPYPEYQERLLLAVQGGNAPDVSTVDQIWNAAFAQAGAIVPLDDYAAASKTVDEASFFPGAWASANIDGQLFGVPFNVDVWSFTFQNQALLAEAGIDPASTVTWEGLRSAAEALTDTDAGRYGIGLFGHKGEDTVVVLNSFIFSNGGSVLADDGSCALDETPAVEALAYLQSLQPYAPEGILNASSGDMRELFLNGALAMEFWPALEQPTLQKSAIDWDFVVGHAPEGKQPVGTYGGWNLVIYESSANQDAAWKFIEFLTSPEVNGDVVDLIPANVAAAEPFLQANRKGPDAIMAHLNASKPRPLSPYYLQIADVQMDMVQALFSGTEAQAAADEACAAIDEITAQ